MTFLLNEPPQSPPVSELYAWVAMDGHGHEGILNMTIPGTGLMPAVTGTRNTAMAIAPFAQAAARMGGYKIELRHYVVAETIETIG